MRDWETQGPGRLGDVVELMNEVTLLRSIVMKVMGPAEDWSAWPTLTDDELSYLGALIPDEPAGEAG